MRRRILVTGGCGFVGAPFVRHLADRGDKVLVYDDLSRGATERLRMYLDTDVRLVVGDVRDVTRLHEVLNEYRPELVVHLAAMHFIPDCDSHPDICLSINVLGTQSVLDAMAISDPIPGLVYASSAAVYGPDCRPHREGESRLAPTDVYGYSKLAGEQLVQAFAERVGTRCSIARLFNVYGPDETNPHLIPTVIRQAQVDECLRLGNLTTQRDYVFTDDVARALTLLGDATLEGREDTCNVGSGEAHTGEEIVATVGKLIGKRLTTISAPERARRSDRPVLCADSSWAREHLGWEPEVAFEDGLARALKQPVGPEVTWR
jgi:UDP-glucose 4-epimerase